MKTLFFKPAIPVEMHEIKELLEKELRSTSILSLE